MNTSASTSNEQTQYEDVIPNFGHRCGSDLITNINLSVNETNSIITLLMGQFNDTNIDRADNETVFYGISAIRAGIDDISSFVSSVKEDQSIKTSSSAKVIEETIDKSVETVKEAIDILYQQFSHDDKDGCLNNETIHALFKSVRTYVTKIAIVARDFIEMIEKQQA